MSKQQTIQTLLNQHNELTDDDFGRGFEAGAGAMWEEMKYLPECTLENTVCEWSCHNEIENEWHSNCGVEIFIDGADTPTKIGRKYCHKCGGEIVEV